VSHFCQLRRDETILKLTWPKAPDGTQNSHKDSDDQQKIVEQSFSGRQLAFKE
jgi:hypothetical protein